MYSPGASILRTDSMSVACLLFLISSSDVPKFNAAFAQAKAGDVKSQLDVVNTLIMVLVH